MIICLLLAVVTIVLGVTLGETLLWWYVWNKYSSRRERFGNYWHNAIVFLTGISDYANPDLSREQIDFLQEIGKQYPVDIIVAEPFPYEAFTPKQFALFEIWRYLGFQEPPLWVISLHNFWQTALTVCFEKVYGNAVARCIINRIGLPKSDNSSLIFICGSTGANLILAAAPTLKQQLRSHLIIISYGGVFRSSKGFDLVDKFYHLIGQKDIWAKLGEIVFPGRLFSWGYFNKAKQENRFSIHYTGEHEHLNYLSNKLPESQSESYRELTLNIVMSVLLKST